MAYQPEPYDLAGFDMIGYTQPDGRIKLGSGKMVKKFPVEVEVCGVTYTLEDIKQNELTADGRGDPTISWGIYV